MQYNNDTKYFFRFSNLALLVFSACGAQQVPLEQPAPTVTKSVEAPVSEAVVVKPQALPVPVPEVVEETELEVVEPGVVEAVEEQDLSTKELTLEAYKFGFEPSILRVKKGDNVVLTLVSRDGSHGVSIPAFGVSSKTFSQGSETTVEFVANKLGEFPIICSVYCGGGHSSMKSKIIVE